MMQQLEQATKEVRLEDLKATIEFMEDINLRKEEREGRAELHGLSLNLSEGFWKPFLEAHKLVLSGTDLTPKQFIGKIEPIPITPEKWKEIYKVNEDYRRRQRKIVIMNCWVYKMVYPDFSLREIARKFNISKASVSAYIKKGEEVAKEIWRIERKEGSPFLQKLQIKMNRFDELYAKAKGVTKADYEKYRLAQMVEVIKRLYGLDESGLNPPVNDWGDSETE